MLHLVHLILTINLTNIFVFFFGGEGIYRDNVFENYNKKREGKKKTLYILHNDLKQHFIIHGRKVQL